ncbi:MAG: hypothetical protein Sylvanvirus14_4 [Sylvanvirus sp.]|uniref:Uncharacterized protein n=1 Tax=Sylvanvirus sp. TaxID=2487774 RepID=A0A3G5ALP9_9VIRU|nr:MAG: hypothetical protein Sylvanvirus14_4 [Sylvanvirus sp.]
MSHDHVLSTAIMKAQSDNVFKSRNSYLNDEPDNVLDINTNNKASHTIEVLRGTQRVSSLIELMLYPIPQKDMTSIVESISELSRDASLHRARLWDIILRSFTGYKDMLDIDLFEYIVKNVPLTHWWYLYGNSEYSSILTYFTTIECLIGCDAALRGLQTILSRTWNPTVLYDALVCYVRFPGHEAAMSDIYYQLTQTRLLELQSFYIKHPSKYIQIVNNVFAVLVHPNQYSTWKRCFKDGDIWALVQHINSDVSDTFATIHRLREELKQCESLWVPVIQQFVLFGGVLPSTVVTDFIFKECPPHLLWKQHHDEDVFKFVTFPWYGPNFNQELWNQLIYRTSDIDLLQEVLNVLRSTQTNMRKRWIDDMCQRLETRVFELAYGDTHSFSSQVQQLSDNICTNNTEYTESKPEKVDLFEEYLINESNQKDRDQQLIDEYLNAETKSMEDEVDVKDIQVIEDNTQEEKSLSSKTYVEPAKYPISTHDIQIFNRVGTMLRHCRL